MKAPTVTGAWATPANSVVGQTVRLECLINGALSPAYPTGNVVFRDGTKVLGSAPVLVGGWLPYAYLDVKFTTPHALSLTASYLGNKLRLPSVSPVVTGTVEQQSVVASLLVSDLAPLAGEPVTVSEHVWPAAPSVTTPKGLVKFIQGTKVLATRPLVNGVASFVTTNLTPGPVDLHSSYLGNTKTLPATVPAAKLPAAMTLNADVNPVTAGAPVQLSASVNSAFAGLSPILTGTVTFQDGATVLGTAPISLGNASIYATFGTSGPHYRDRHVLG